MSLLRSLQDILPKSFLSHLGTVVGTVWPIATRKGFLTHYRFLNASQWWSNQEFDQYQKEKLLQLLEYAYTNIPMYHSQWDDIGFNPKDLRSVEDLERFPIISRTDVIQHLSDFVSRDTSRFSYSLQHTSGSTGSPMTIAVGHDVELWETAFTLRHSTWVPQTTVESPTIWLRGVAKNNRRLWYYHPSTRSYFFSAYHLTPENIREYANIMRSIRAPVLRSYPSGAYIFARSLLEQGIPLSFNGVITSSEKLLPEHRAVIEKQFSCKVYDHYGQAELTGLIQQCESTRYHVQQDYGIVELKDRPDLGQGRAEVIATGFINKTMPLIRYNTGDIVLRCQQERGRCPCGREGLFIQEIEGRVGDILHAPGGRLAPPVNFYTLFYYFTEAILQFQLFQESIDSVEVRIVPTPAFTKKIEEEIALGLHQRLSSDIRLVFRYVDEIERDARTGKIKNIICRL